MRSKYIILCTTIILLGLSFLCVFMIYTDHKNDRKQTPSVGHFTENQTIKEESKSSESTNAISEYDVLQSHLINDGHEYQGIWSSSDRLIEFTVEKLFDSSGGGCNNGKYIFNDEVYDVMVDFTPYPTDDGYDGYIFIYIEIPEDEFGVDIEPIISGEYKMNSNKDVISVTVNEVDIDGWSPTYEDSRSVYKVGDEVVFEKQEMN